MARWSTLSWPDQVDGSGKRGQVLKGDVIDALEKGVTPQKAAAPAAARGPSSGDDAAREERVKMTAAPDHRPAAEGRAEHRRHADHLQRGGHERR
jgi:pyruvate/2-oxoglutarate dehydrogenase complex dihydrolipoamide acyltransferase (E2) component